MRPINHYALLMLALIMVCASSAAIAETPSNSPMDEAATAMGAPAWLQEQLPTWVEPFVGKHGMPSPWSDVPSWIGWDKLGMGCDRYQANRFIVYRPETADYLYGGEYTPLTPVYRRGVLPLYEHLLEQDPVCHAVRQAGTPREKAMRLLQETMPALVRHPNVPPSGLWTLVQVGGPGMCLMPVTQKDGIPLYRDHAEAYKAQGVQEQVQPIPKENIIVTNDLLAWPVDGTLRGKIGLHPAVARPAYGFMKVAPDATLLYILEYPLDPQGLYVESPQYIPYDYGEAIQIYVASGDGGYAGMQVHAPAHPIKTGEMLSHQVRFSVFRGPHADILPLAAELLGVKMESLQRF